MNTPLGISVLTPVFNGAAFIEGAIDSVSAQSGPWEHVVMDGGSVDGTRELLERRGSSNLVWRSEPDRGQSDALNKAFTASTCDVVGWLNADERYLPGAFDRVREVFSQEPDIDVVYGEYLQASPSGGCHRLVASHRYSRFVLRNYGCFVPSCATFVRRALLTRVRWDTDLRWVMDWDLWLALDANGARFRHLGEPLAVFLVHPEQVTARDRSAYEHEWTEIRQRYAIRLSNHDRWQRWLGRAGHAVLKAMDGGYGRERRIARGRWHGDH